MTFLESQPQSLYGTDFLQWIETTAKKLRTQDYANLDWENVIEEIEAIGRSERKSLKSNLIILLLHFLKWQYQPEQRTGSWEGSIVEHRRRIREALKDSPSLKLYLETIFFETYTDAVKQAKAETGLPLATFPQQYPYQLTEVMEEDFLPH